MPEIDTDSGESAASETQPGDAPSSPAASGTGGRRIGRYVVLEPLGTGGMATVVAAYDPRLDRRVAIKVLAPSDDHRRQRARLTREARALAQLSDPHVVSVYEVGVHQDRVFVVMELVEGTTLRRWLGEARRGWRDVLAVFREAGRGLAAAHAVGLVHRDFKPENVLIGRPEPRRAFGRVRVADFGLARADTPGSEAAIVPMASDSSIREITRAGVAPGTPAYMAPEQFLGAPLNARTDQFSFCVALFEALYGRRPFAGRTRIEVADAVVSGRIEPPPPADVPAWVHAVLLRGLSTDPEQRFGSMHELLDALDRDPVARRHRRLATVGLGCVAIVGLSAWWPTARPRVEPCTDLDVHLADAWNDASRTHIREAFAGSGARASSARAEQVITVLDRYARRWLNGYADACEAAAVRHELTPALLDRRTACLSRRRQAFAALVEILGRADRVVVDHALEAVADLPVPEPCADVDFFSRAVEPPADPLTARRVESVRAAIARVEAELNAGHVQAALAAAETMLQDATTIPYPPVRAEAGLMTGIAREAAGELARAESILQSSYFEALAAGTDDIAAAAAVHLVYVVGYALHRDHDGMQWAHHARAAVARPGVDPARRTRLALEVSTVHLAFGRAEEAERELVDAIAELRRRGDHPVQLGIALNTLGGVLVTRGEPQRAEPLFDEALALLRDQLGENHPNVATVLQNLGTVAWHAGDYALADAHQRRALAIGEATQGPDHPDVASSLAALAGTAVALEDFERADALLERALSILEGRTDQQAMQASLLHNLAVVRRGLDHPLAVDTARQALAAVEGVYGPSHPELARAHANLGWLLLARGEATEAGAHFARALAIRETNDAPLGDVADARFGVARAQWLDAQRRAAMATARQALDEARRAGPDEAPLVERITTWLDDPDP